MLRGEIWWGIWPNDPDRKARPLLIISNNFRNQTPRILDVIIVKLTSLRTSTGAQKPINPVEDLVVQLRKPTLIRCGAIFTVEKAWLTSKAGQVSASELTQINGLLKNVLELN